MKDTLDRWLTGWLTLVTRRPWLVLAVAAVLTAVGGWYTVTRLGINTDTSTLVPASEPFRVAEANYLKVFPENDNVILIVVQDKDALAAADAARAIAGALARYPKRFSYVYAPGTGPFFDRNGLLYLDKGQLAKVLDDLAQAQPALAVLSQDPSLRGLFDALGHGLQATGQGQPLPPAFGDVMTGLANAARQVEQGSVPRQSLLPGLAGAPGEVQTRLVMTRQRLDYSQALSAASGIDQIRAVAANLRKQGAIADSTSVRLTGETVLANDELVSVTQGVKIAGIVSLVLLVIILAWGYRSIRLISTSYGTLLIGLVWAGAFATATIGELNMISASCAVLFVGLGIDYAIHFCLRYAENLRREDQRSALVDTGRQVGPALMLCVLTTVIGFLSFAPTDYKGFADLGVIAAGGVTAAFLASLTVLPALLAIVGVPKRAQWRPIIFSEVKQRWSDRGAKLMIVLAILSVPVALSAHFDFSTLALKDPNSESVTTLEDLTKIQGNLAYAAYAVADNLDDAERLAAKLRKLPEVDEVVTPRSYVPADQDEKLEMLQEAAMFMWPVFNPDHTVPPPTAKERLQAAQQFLGRAENAHPADENTAQAIASLRQALTSIVEDPDRDAKLKTLEQALISGVQERIARLRSSFNAAPVRYQDLPADMVSRDISPSGKVSLTILPAGDMSKHDQLEAFADAVTAVVPGASGRAIGEAGMAKVVIGAFEIASALTIVLISLLLYAILRRWRDVVLVLAPLAVAGSLTAATAVLTGIQFNFANVIVLPLLLGFGVDSSTHLLLRRREEGSVAELMESSTPRAVTLSALTTIASFGSLSLSPHWGTASLGLLLTVAMVMIELSAVFVMPALMRWFGSGPSQPV
ncbi:MAG: MMPL family transporter [Alphaproteobacteria bacterium]|nr:MMPL family transporter [Alphaproteobacteria bacterium]